MSKPDAKPWGLPPSIATTLKNIAFIFIVKLKPRANPPALHDFVADIGQVRLLFNIFSEND
jgi:hypothetical protein